MGDYINTKIELYNNPLIVPFDIFDQQEVIYYFPKAKQVNRKSYISFNDSIQSNMYWEVTFGEKKSELIKQVTSQKRLNSYEIIYDRTRKKWPFNTGDCMDRCNCISKIYPVNVNWLLK
jgi:hypothetical protein